MDKILLMLDVQNDNNVVTVTEGDSVVSDMYTKKEIIEKLNEIIEFLMSDELEGDRLWNILKALQELSKWM